MKKQFSSKLLTSILIASVSLSVQAASTVYVTSAENDGAGSLRAALMSSAKVIKISESISSISITEPLVYQGQTRLKLLGSNQIIDGSALPQNTDIFTVSNGADLIMSRLNFIGGSFEVNPHPDSPVGGKGIFVNVPTSRTGVVKVELKEVAVTGVGNHGVHVSDCSLRDDCGGGSGGGGQGSAASIHVKLDDVLINRVGFGKQDADGVRIDERGEGDIYFAVKNSTFINVGADGIELDEGNDGDIVADVRDSLFDSNGEYCVLVPFVAGGQCDDDGEADVDDGFDIDEAGAGSLFVQVRNSNISNNFDEGLDFDEEDDGDISVRVFNVLAVANKDEGIKASEEGKGDIKASLKRLTTVENNGSKESVELEEADKGDVTVKVSDSVFIGGKDEDLKVEQTGKGKGTVKIRRSNIQSLDFDGVSQI